MVWRMIDEESLHAHANLLVLLDVPLNQISEEGDVFLVGYCPTGSITAPNGTGELANRFLRGKRVVAEPVFGRSCHLSSLG